MAAGIPWENKVKREGIVNKHGSVDGENTFRPIIWIISSHVLAFVPKLVYFSIHIGWMDGLLVLMYYWSSVAGNSDYEIWKNDGMSCLKKTDR